LSWRRWTDRLKHSQSALRFADFLGRGRGRMRWLDHVHTVRRPRKPDLSRWHDEPFAAAWLGHATILLRVGGKTILTDPVLSNRVGVGLGLMTGGPLRHLAPALTLKELPAIDLILISHAHFDHLDRPTLCRLPKDTPVVTAHHTADLIEDLGFRSVREMRWGESLETLGLRLIAREVRHWGARTFFDRHRGFNAYLIESLETGHRVLYGGDSAYHEHFKDIPRVDLAIVGIGAYDPYEAAHATPEQAWAMANHMNADYVLPMHHSTFCLSHEPMDEPIERMLTAAGEEAGRIVVREVGGQWSARA
jgi:L-ascorbate metabolism protein UlaG (beta-lactamase superfamily)